MFGRGPAVRVCVVRGVGVDQPFSIFALEPTRCVKDEAIRNKREFVRVLGRARRARHGRRYLPFGGSDRLIDQKRLS